MMGDGDENRSGWVVKIVLEKSMPILH